MHAKSALYNCDVGCTPTNSTGQNMRRAQPGRHDRWCSSELLQIYGYLQDSSGTLVVLGNLRQACIKSLSWRSASNAESSLLRSGQTRHSSPPGSSTQHDCAGVQHLMLTSAPSAAPAILRGSLLSEWIWLWSALSCSHCRWSNEGLIRWACTMIRLRAVQDQSGEVSVGSCHKRGHL